MAGSLSGGAASPSERVRRDCRRVAGAARRVAIDGERLAAYAAALEPESLELPRLDPGCHFLGHGEHTVAFMLTLEAVNFGSASFEQLRRDGEASGYFTVAGALTRYFERRGPLSAEQLAATGPAECAEIFGQAGNPRSEPLMGRFAGALNSLGRHLLEHAGGSFSQLLAAAGGSADRLVELMLGNEHFRDQARYDGETVRFYKRAQLTAADLSLAFEGREIGRLVGLEGLTIFADDLVPHVLRMDGILRYDPPLAAKIDRGEHLEAGSPEEVEIRAGAVHAAELIVAELRRRGREVCAMQVDYCLWNRGLRAFYQAKPRHRTVTDFY